MTWLLWRQHRAQALFAAVAFAAFAILLWITGVHFADTYRTALATCTPTDTCDQLSLFRGDGALIDIVNLSAAVPLLMGLFWGVPAVGREFDSGTTSAGLDAERATTRLAQRQDRRAADRCRALGRRNCRDRHVVVHHA